MCLPCFQPVAFYMDVSNGAAFAVWDAGDKAESFLFVRSGRVRLCLSVTSHCYTGQFITIQKQKCNTL